MKSEDEVVSEFNGLVNMTASELEKWLKSDDSNSAGWPKDNGDGESVGHDSGRRIVEILKSNPTKDPTKYTEEQITHMRKVVSYCKRHLAQEGKANSEKPEEEVKKTKSYASLKNWGHDPLKARQRDDKEEDEGIEDEEEQEEIISEEDSNEENEHAGDKRKAHDGQSGANKRRELLNKKATSKKDEQDDEDDQKHDDKKGDKNAKPGQSNGEKENEKNGSKKGGENGKMVDSAPDKDDTVSWNWGNGQPEGKVLDVKAEKTSIETKKGNEVSRNGSKEDPAVVLDTGKSKAIKLNHELNET